MKQERNLCDICKEVLEVGTRDSEVVVKIQEVVVLEYNQICFNCAQLISNMIESYKKRFSRKKV